MSGIIFTLSLLLALCADSLPLWALIAPVVGMAAFASVIALAGFVNGKKKDRLDGANIEAATWKMETWESF